MPELPRQIPLFPLPNAVLFPKLPLPLHVFEPRYRKMVKDALGTHRTIGMVLLRPGFESDYEGRPPVFSPGCAGVIEDCQALPDGRYDIVLRGRARFQIVEEHAGEPYRLATIEPLHDTPGDEAALALARRQVMAAIGRAADGPAVLVMQQELSHELFVNALGQSMNLLPVERQSLLDCDSVLARYQRLIEILDFKQLEASFGGGPSKTIH